MMASTTIKCPECSGDKIIVAGNNKYICQYCGATFIKEAPPTTANAETTRPKTLCQFCGEEIVFGAQKCRHCGEWLNRPQQVAPQPIYVQNVQPQYSTANSKNKVVAALLAFFLGGFGVHEFYLGKSGAGIAFLLISIFTFWLFWPMLIIGIICLIQGISYLCMSDEQFAAKYH